MVEQFCDRVVQESSRMVREYYKHLEPYELREALLDWKVPKMKELPQLEQHPYIQELKWCPDNEDIGFKLNSAFKIFKRIRFFNFVRGQILANQAEGFLKLSDCLKQPSDDKEIQIKGWKTPEHDLSLLMAISEKGFEFLNEIKNHDHYQMQTLKVNKSKLVKRAEWVVEQIKCQMDKSGFTPKGVDAPPVISSEKSKRVLADQIDRETRCSMYGQPGGGEGRSRTFIPKDNR